VSGYLLRRFIHTIFVLIIVSIMVFLVMRILPGDPVYLYIGEEQCANYTPQEIEKVRHELGLDRPLAIQYLSWIGGVTQGDFGISLVFHTPIIDEITKRLPITIYLGSIAFVISIILGIPLGIVAAIRRGKWEDTFSTTIANIGITVPSFWLGILAIYLFGLRLNWLPTFGYTSPFDNFGMSLKQAVMPVFCLSIFAIASAARQTRSSMLEVIQQDYIRTAWSKGLRERSVILGHALKNSLIPVITLKGLTLRGIVGGSVLIETVFNIPGMGRLAVDAILTRDFAIVQAVFLIIGIVVSLANLLVDIIYGWVDPRIRLA
jgi:peptide/nickel transport system permease protein